MTGTRLALFTARITALPKGPADASAGSAREAATAAARAQTGEGPHPDEQDPAGCVLPALAGFTVRLVTSSRLIWCSDGSLVFEGAIADARAFLESVGPDEKRCKLTLEAL